MLLAPALPSSDELDKTVHSSLEICSAFCEDIWIDFLILALQNHPSNRAFRDKIEGRTGPPTRYIMSAYETGVLGVVRNAFHDIREQA